MNEKVVRDDWESSVLGIRVGVLSIDATKDTVEMHAYDDRFDVIFVKCRGWVDQGHCALTALEYLYDMEAKVDSEKPKTSRVSTMSFPGKQHIEIAEEAFPDSRFARDHRLSKKAAERYVRWISENQSYVPTEAPNDAFLVAKDDPDGARRISLIAVAQRRRGSGLGKRLVRGVFEAESTRKLWRVRVSARNYRAIGFYESLGFRVVEVFTNFHHWMKCE